MKLKIKQSNKIINSKNNWNMAIRANNSSNKTHTHTHKMRLLTNMTEVPGSRPYGGQRQWKCSFQWLCSPSMRTVSRTDQMFRQDDSYVADVQTNVRTNSQNDVLTNGHTEDLKKYVPGHSFRDCKTNNTKRGKIIITAPPTIKPRN